MRRNQQALHAALPLALFRTCSFLRLKKRNRIRFRHWQRRSGARLHSFCFADRLPLSAANNRPKRVRQAINERNFHVRYRG